MQHYRQDIELLSDELKVEFIVLHGKHADGNMILGCLVGLSDNGAKLRCEYDLEILTNIKIKLLTEAALFEEESAVYAKVMKKFAQEENHFLIRFTGIPPKGLQKLKKARES